MRDFRKLKVLQRAHALTLELYRITASFPPEERYGLASQIRRASSAIGQNLAEGAGRNGDRELGRYCSIALGEASELEYHLLLARDLQMIGRAEWERVNARTVEVKRMLAAFQRTLRADC